jgi:hypothetical protein
MACVLWGIGLTWLRREFPSDGLQFLLKDFIFAS